MLVYSSDLVRTTESLRSAKLSAGKTEKECSNYDTILEPYKTENAQLTKENNELHLEILKLKEQSDHHVKGIIKIMILFLILPCLNKIAAKSLICRFIYLYLEVSVSGH